MTASEIDALVTPGLQLKKDRKAFDTYLAAKLDEAIAGEPTPGPNGYYLEQGHLKEEEAIPWYEMNFSPVRKVGFIETDDRRAGCSPDGLIGDDCGLECKCPAGHTHVKYLLKAAECAEKGLPDCEAVPSEYMPQIHMSLYVTGREKWCFMSYSLRHPALLLWVYRDEEVCKTIADALAKFYAAFDDGMKKLKSFK